MIASFWRKWMPTSVVLGLCLLLLGCGESSENRLERARIALSAGQSDQALQLAEGVLQAQPDNLEAMKVIASAQLNLQNLGGARRTLDRLLELRPDEPQMHQMLVDWSLRQTYELLGESDFLTAPERQQQFRQALDLGHFHADWLQKQQGDTAQVRYDRARLYHAEYHRQQQLRRQNRTEYDKLLIAGTAEQVEQVQAALEQIDGQQTYLAQQIDQHLQAALAADPALHAARALYAQHLRTREAWPALLELARQSGALKNLPADLAEQLVLAALESPQAPADQEERLAAAEKLQAAVKESERKSARWKISQSRIELRRRQPEKAETLLREALRAQPRDLDTRYLLARALFDQGKFADAKPVVEGLRKDAPTSPTVLALFGQVMMKAGDTVGALNAMRQAADLTVQAGPGADDGSMQQALITVMASQGEIEAAAPDIEQLYERHPADPMAIRYKLQYHRLRSEPGQVAGVLAQTERIDPLLDEHLGLLLEGYTYLHDYPKVEAYARRLSERQPENREAHVILAHAILAQGREEEALAEVDRLVQAEPGEATREEVVGQLYMRLGQLDRARQVYEQALAGNLGSSDLRLQLAAVLYDLNRPAEALEQVETVIEQEPANIDALAMAARIHLLAGQQDKADDYLARIDPNAVNVEERPALKAQMELRAGNLGEAASICNRALTAGNADPTLRLLLIAIYMREQRLDKAEQHLTALIREFPNNHRAFELLTGFYIRHRMFDQGRLRLAELQAVNEPLARLGQAMLLTANDQPELAVQELQVVYEPLLAKGDLQAIAVAQALTSLHLRLDQPEQARAVAQALIDHRLAPEWARIHQVDLQVAREQPLTAERRTELVSQLSAIAEGLSAPQLELKRMLLDRLVRLQAGGEAEAWLDRWLAEGEEHQALLLLWKGQLLVRTGRPDRAIEPFQRIIALQPEAPLLRLRLAEAYRGSLQFPEAEAVYREMADLGEGARAAALAHLMQMYQAIGLSEQARQTFSEIGADDRTLTSEALLAVAHTLEALGQTDQAQLYFARVQPASPAYVPAQLALARLEQQAGSALAARQRLNQLASQADLAPRLIAALAAVDWRTPQGRQLLQWADETMDLAALPAALQQRWLKARLGLASLDEDWRRTLETVEALAKLTPADPQVLALRVLVMARLQRLEMAQAVYRDHPELQKSAYGRLLSIFVELPPDGEAPTTPMIDLVLAAAGGDWAGARSFLSTLPRDNYLFEADLNDFLTQGASQPQAMRQVPREVAGALLAYQAGLPALGVAHARQVTRLMPDLTIGYGLLAAGQEALGQPLDEVYEQVRTRQPASSLTLYLTGKIHAREGRFAQAAQATQELLKREPGHPQAPYLAAGMLHRAGQAAQAITLLEKIAKEPGRYQAAAVNDLAYLLAETQPERLSEAAELAQQALAAAPGASELHDTLGWIAYLQGNHAAALQYLQAAALRLGHMAEVQYHLGSAFRAAGNETWARYYLAAAARGPADHPEVQRARDLLSTVSAADQPD